MSWVTFAIKIYIKYHKKCNLSKQGIPCTVLRVPPLFLSSMIFAFPSFCLLELDRSYSMQNKLESKNEYKRKARIRIVK